MFTNKNIDKICIGILIMTLLLTVIFINGERLGISVITDKDAESYNGSEYFTDNDLDGDWMQSDYTITYITLEGSEGSVDGSGAYFFNGDLIIASGGHYVISGTLDDGEIIVDSDASAKVWIGLNGVTINCSDDACFRIDQADKVFLTLADGTNNVFVSGEDYSEEALSDNTGGAIFSHDDLTINGSGNLTVTANYKHGIDVNDSLVITGGNITITAVQDAVHVNDSFHFADASLTINAGDDAIHSDGEIYVESGSILINSCYEGMEALTVDIAGGDITIYSEDDGINANGNAAGFGSSGEDTTEYVDVTDTYIRISGGSLTIINENGQDADGLDSNGNIYIDGGDIRICIVGNGSNSAIDYGSESGGECIVTGGTIIAFGGSGMAEELSKSSTQCAVLYNLDSTVQAGSTFNVTNADGEEILSYTTPYLCSSVAFSSPELTTGNTYIVSFGENEIEFTPETAASSIGEQSHMNEMPHNESDMPAGHEHDGDNDRPSPPDAGTGKTPNGQVENSLSDTSPEVENTKAAAAGGIYLKDIDKSIWFTLIISSLALTAGILFAKNRKKR